MNYQSWIDSMMEVANLVSVDGYEDFIKAYREET